LLSSQLLISAALAGIRHHGVFISYPDPQRAVPCEARYMHSGIIVELRNHLASPWPDATVIQEY